MKLSRIEIQKISNLYNLGKVVKYTLIKGGLVNHNFDLVTNKGSFIIRILGHEMTDWKKERLRIEFAVLDFLGKNSFPYEVPNPIMNRKREILTKFGKKTLWVYKKIEGEPGERRGNYLKEAAKALSVYHKYIKKFNIKGYSQSQNDEWLFQKYREMARVRSKRGIDKLMLKNLKFFNQLLKKLNNLNFHENPIPNHRDMSRRNLLFEKNKVIGIIDFDNIEIMPKVNDVAYSIKSFCDEKDRINKGKMKTFLEEYEKLSALSKKEKELIIPYILRDNCIVFWWFYAEMKKKKHLKEVLLKDIITKTKNIVREFNVR